MTEQINPNVNDITGYRELSESEIQDVNLLKAMGRDIGEFIDTLGKNPDYDGRWLAIGRTHMQQGLMALVRGVARPTSF